MSWAKCLNIMATDSLSILERGWIYLCEGQLSDGGQGQVGVKQRDAIRHAHSAICRPGGQQQPVDAAAGEKAAVQVHLDISPTG